MWLVDGSFSLIFVIALPIAVALVLILSVNPDFWLKLYVLFFGRMP